ncbi:hypothetical protein SMI01S_16250 [Sphingobacterium mizutaii NBRC 14946 = DSM 11724]|uniref:Hyaluronan synthase n=2 Tax=Sphingobacterium mizutaii TaxID=1010 RepID=A0AAJ4X872_9SPHI|nr:glycosyltransferase [Sphingobacterium mizutaii]GEM68019.1 hypothetical protein SMI01S_16250 [Sphingobacterium mizutaii NBRC 14946 = DSM 11724]SDL78290.1 Glycosyl transferase family 2 [Sphingobacterium mizutaii]SNV37802.1 Hyaluronan synthase [Sphingobacterium mizutaii]
MPETTVLIPTFNNSQYIIQSLKSVINQKYRDFEVIIIDDCSDDNTEELVSELDTRIRYFRKKTKTGIVSCLNEGLAYATGKFIARMDADDIMLGNRLLNQVNFLNNNKEYGVVGSKYNVISKDGEILETVSTKQNDEELRLGLLFKNQFAHSSVTFRRELHSKVLKYHKKYEFVEDYALWCEFSKISKLANLPEINLSYRIHGKNSSHENQTVLRSNLVKLFAIVVISIVLMDYRN